MLDILYLFLPLRIITIQCTEYLLCYTSCLTVTVIIGVIFFNFYLLARWLHFHIMLLLVILSHCFIVISFFIVGQCRKCNLL